MNYQLPVLVNTTTKTAITQHSENVVNQLLESGFIVQAAEQIAIIENFVATVKKDKRFIECLRDELQKSSGKLKTNNGVSIEAAEVGTKYDFSNCGDPVLIRLEQSAAKISEQLEQRKAFLKTVDTSGYIITDEETGETTKVYPPSKTSTSSYKVTIAK